MSTTTCVCGGVMTTAGYVHQSGCITLRRKEDTTNAVNAVMSLQRQLADRRRAEIWQAAVAFAKTFMEQGEFQPPAAVARALTLHAEFEKQLAREGNEIR